VEIDPKYDPDICFNVINWENTRLLRRVFVAITMSTPCSVFSKAQTVWARELLCAIAVVKKVLGIIQYFRPSRWCLETNCFGLLPQQDFIEVFQFCDLDFCQYGD